MRRILKLSVLCSAAVAAAACKPDEVIRTEVIPTAGVRFINAVPDTFPLDFRFVDLVENSAHFRITFRNNPVTTSGIPASTSIQYKPARAGAARHFRVFVNDTIQANATIVLKDSTLNLEEGHNYSVIMMGQARQTAGPDAMRLVVLDETALLAAAGAFGTNVGLRVMNLTGSAIDVRTFQRSAAVPGAATFANVAPYTATSWVLAAPDSFRYNVRAAGGTNSLFADAEALRGAAATVDITPLPGTLVAGSAVTGVVFPGSVVGSLGAQFATTTGSARMRVTATGYEGPRSFAGDGFVVGMTINATGFTDGTNNGPSTITAITGQSTTTLPNTTNSGSANFPRSIIADASATGSYTIIGGSTFSANFTPGTIVTVSGFTDAQNNGEAVVVSGGGTANLQVTKTGGTVLEGGNTGSTSLSATATGYSRSAGSFLADGFRIGHAIRIIGFGNAQNNGSATITGISATGTDITVSKTGGTVPEAEAAGRRILVSTNRSFASFGRITVNRALVPENTGNSRRLTADPAPQGISFMWDQRPPRTCSPLC